MSLFNKRKRNRQKVINRAGGQAFRQSPKMKLASLLITSFAQEQFYRSVDETYQELINLLVEVDALFAAKAAVFARNQFGMRSITHVLAAEIAKYASGSEWAKDFYKAVVRRPDDMLEITAYYLDKGGKKLPNAMRKGFSNAFDKFDGYQLAKYRGENKAVKLIDLVNLVRPVPTQRNAKALQELVAGTLRSTTTWESKLTKAGAEAEDAKDKAKRKAAAWEELISANKLGYFALLRNLRNIMEQAPHLGDQVKAILTDEVRIRKSLVLPFRFLTAMDAVTEADFEGKREIQRALNQAIEVSLSNVPRFEGKMLVVLDDSGSMVWGRKNLNRTPIQIGALFAAVLYKANDADLMRFSDNASYVDYYFGDPALTMANRLVNNARAAGTNFHAIFKKAKHAYDRIIILSDMQGWMGYNTPVETFRNYKLKTGADPFVYSFDLQGYGSLQFPEDKVYALAGFSEKVFDLMKLLETDRNALIKKIEAIEV